MLDNYWDQTLAWFTTKAYQVKDKKSQDVAEFIDKVPEVVREYVLKRILKQNQILSSIATYKKRQQEKPDVADCDEIGLQVFKLQGLLITEIRGFDPQRMLKGDTKKNGAIKDDVLL